MDDLYLVLKLSVASGTIASVISEAQIFLPFREWVKTKSVFFGKLFRCGWCVSFWIAFALESIYLPNLFHSVVIIDQILTSFCIAYGSGLVWLLITGLMKLTDK